MMAAQSDKQQGKRTNPPTYYHPQPIIHSRTHAHAHTHLSLNLSIYRAYRAAYPPLHLFKHIIKCDVNEKKISPSL